MNSMSKILTELDGDTSSMFASQLAGWNHGGNNEPPLG